MVVVYLLTEDIDWQVKTLRFRRVRLVSCRTNCRGDHG